jgi:hypothetical protein
LTQKLRTNHSKKLLTNIQLDNFSLKLIQHQNLFDGTLPHSYKKCICMRYLETADIKSLSMKRIPSIPGETKPSLQHHLFGKLTLGELPKMHPLQLQIWPHAEALQ